MASNRKISKMSKRTKSKPLLVRKQFSFKVFHSELITKKVRLSGKSSGKGRKQAYVKESFIVVAVKNCLLCIKTDTKGSLSEATMSNNKPTSA